MKQLARTCTSFLEVDFSIYPSPLICTQRLLDFQSFPAPYYLDPRLLGTVEYLHLFHFSLVFLIWGKLLWIFIDKWDLIVLNLIVSNLLKQRFWFVENNFSQIVFNFQANLNLSLQNLQNREHYRYFSALLLDMH